MLHQSTFNVQVELGRGWSHEEAKAIKMFDYVLYAFPTSWKKFINKLLFQLFHTIKIIVLYN